MTEAVIFVPPGATNAGTVRCLDYCAAKRYHVVGLVPGDWTAAVRLLHDGKAAVIVVPSADQRDRALRDAAEKDAAQPRPVPLDPARVEVVPKRLNSRRRTLGATRTSRYPARMSG